jgi:hypothetical protein
LDSDLQFSVIVDSINVGRSTSFGRTVVPPDIKLKQMARVSRSNASVGRSGIQMSRLESKRIVPGQFSESK